MAARSAQDLLDNPMTDESTTSARTPPVNKAISYLAVTDGLNLEILTRTNRPIVAAIDAGTVYTIRYRSRYIMQRIQQMERLAISSDGLGRTEMIEAVRAGGSMPDSFYQPGPMPSDYDPGDYDG